MNELHERILNDFALHIVSSREPWKQLLTKAIVSMVGISNISIGTWPVNKLSDKSRTCSFEWMLFVKKSLGDPEKEFDLARNIVRF